jgi:hypothetical protein
VSRGIASPTLTLLRPLAAVALLCHCSSTFPDAISGNASTWT